ncbi:MAG: hypothetical protein PHP66_00335 [Syntrophales bacterium]|nr:hypothetical protein [Syntrophales bacterium]
MDVSFSPWLVWFLAGIAVMFAELAVPGFVIIFFELSRWGATLVALFYPNAYSFQVAAFVVVSVASLMMLRKWPCAFSSDAARGRRPAIREI